LLKRAEISGLCRLLAPLQPTAGGGSSAAAPSAAASNRTNETDPKPYTRPTLPIAAVTVPKPAPTTTKEGRTAMAPPPALKPIALSDTAKRKLNNQGRVQETLTDELADLAAAMKTNTLAMEAKVKERGTLLDGTEAALDKSATETKTAAARATVAHRRGRRNFCFTFLVLFIIGTVFVGMYLFIRITSITGYRAAKVVAAPPRVITEAPPPPPSLSENDISDPLQMTHTEL
jgi:Membrane fusion protein Use1